MLPYPRIESNRVMIYTARRVPAAHTERWATVYLFFLPLLALSRSVTPLPQPSISPAAAAGRLEGAIQGSDLSGSCKGHDLFFFFWLCDQAPRLSVFLPPSTSSEAGMWWFLKPKKKLWYDSVLQFILIFLCEVTQTKPGSPTPSGKISISELLVLCTLMMGYHLW